MYSFANVTYGWSMSSQNPIRSVFLRHSFSYLRTLFRQSALNSAIPNFSI